MGECIGIVLAAGIGLRTGMNVPKQYVDVNENEVISYTIDAFKESNVFDDIIVVVDNDEHIDYIKNKYEIKSIIGGKTRNESFYCALQYISTNFPHCSKIIVNEAARPLITPKIILDFNRLLDEYPCVYCVKDVTDSLESVDGEYRDRTKYQLVMSPEGYDFHVIWKYFEMDSKTTFPGHTIPKHYSRYQYRDYTDNMKITYFDDFKTVESLLMNRK